MDEQDFDVIPEPAGQDRDDEQLINPPSSTLLDYLLLPVRWLLRPGNADQTNPTLDTTNFISEFDEMYGSAHPPFHPASYMSAVSQAFRGSRFVMVYIHSPIHEDSNKFCSEVLCSQTMVDFVSQNNITTWVGKVWDLEAYGLCNQLHTSAYPFVALLVCQSERVVQVAERIQGFVDDRTAIERLRGAVTNFSVAVERSRTESNRRQEAVRLREQQDIEYRESAEMDRLQQQRIRSEEEARVAAIRAAEQEEALRRATEEARVLDRDSNLQRIRDHLLASPEPKPGPDVAVVRFQLPSGKKVTRHFFKTDVAQFIYDFLQVYFADEGNPDMSFSVSTHFPKMTLEDMNQNVEALALYPRGVLYVQDLNA